MANLLSRRRSEPETAPPQTAPPQSAPPQTAPPPAAPPQAAPQYPAPQYAAPQQQPVRRDTFTERIERAAGRAANAARSAAASAAAERVRRPRTSMMATLGLVVSVAAVLAVASGSLVRLGIALGAVGLLFGLIGLATTRRRHVSGSTEAIIALLLSLGAVVVGILAVSDQLSWLSPDTDNVARLRDWLPGWLD
jgi:hypothetical protein